MVSGLGVWLLGTVTGVALYIWMVERAPDIFQSKNFLGKSIPSSAGVALIICCVVAYAGLFTLHGFHRPLLFQISFATVITFGGLGLADDIFGDRSIGGLRGHFKQLFQHKQLTTGAAKAIGGTIAALAASYLIHPGHPIAALIGAAIIALMANAVNLTDTRPGRALSIGLAIMVIGLTIGHRELDQSAGMAFIPLVALTIALFLFDRRAALMIGDSGANSVGALTGLLWVILCPLPAQTLFLVILLWFHWWTESHSLNETIKKTAWLNELDRLIGTRH